MSMPDDWILTERLHAPTGKGDPFAAAVRATRMPMLITDPRRDDNPIVFANDAFLRMTGYARSEVMGRNCRFLQGPATDQNSVSEIRDAIREREDLSVEILNYRKDGTTFWNALYMSPVSDEEGELLFFFASQIDVTDRKQAELDIRAAHAKIEKAVEERTRELSIALQEQTELVHEVDHRVKNNLQLILALIRIGQRDESAVNPEQALRTLQRRVEALAGVHRKVFREGGRSGFDLAAYLSEFASLTGSMESRMKVDADRAPVQVRYAAPVALIASELASIAQVHAEKHAGSQLRLTLKQITDTRYRCCLSGEGGGQSLVEDVTPQSRAFIDMLVPQMHASVEWAVDRNRICVDVPADIRDRTADE